MQKTWTVVTRWSTANEGYFDSGDTNEKLPSSQPGDDGQDEQEIPDWKFFSGLTIFALTNVGFLKLFEVCSEITDIKVVVTWMGVYYAVALLLRVILRKVIGLGPWFPQFFWEGMPSKKPPR
jgi:hypothetical protein